MKVKKSILSLLLYISLVSSRMKKRAIYFIFLMPIHFCLSIIFHSLYNLSFYYFPSFLLTSFIPFTFSFFLSFLPSFPFCSSILSFLFSPICISFLLLSLFLYSPYLDLIYLFVYFKFFFLFPLPVYCFSVQHFLLILFLPFIFPPLSAIFLALSNYHDPFLLLINFLQIARVISATLDSFTS